MTAIKHWPAWHTVFTIVAGVILVGGLAVYTLRRVQGRLPYHDHFAAHEAEEWTPFGGTWEIADGAIYNRSDERGAKLITGSPKWTNYMLDADLELIGHEGDVGVIVRSSQEEPGIDSYNGYYIGLRSVDSALVIGRADHGWMEGRPVSVPGGVRSSMWFNLRVVAFDCHIGAVATNLHTGQHAWAAFEEEPCKSSGRIGLRSMNTGGAWRNLTVSQASFTDWQTIRAHVAEVEHPDFPKREADYNRMRDADFGKTYMPAQPHGVMVLGGLPELHLPPPRLVTIGSLRSMSSSLGLVMIRGVVTFTSPTVYVEDATGSVAVHLPPTVLLNIGDEVEITGQLEIHGYAATLKATSARLLWDRTPVVPLSISVAQAASGTFDSSLVEMRGTLLAKSKDSRGAVTLNLEDQSQTFVALVGTALSSRAYDTWKPGSLLRLRGICVLDERVTQDRTSFVLLVRSLDDVEVLAGPPWWSGRQLARWIVPLFVLLLLFIAFFLYLERWRMRAILNERERLAYEMHDTLAQSFAGVGFHLQGVRNTMRGGKQRSTEDILAKLDVACDLVSHTHREASANIAALHPDADKGRNLLMALEQCTLRMVDIGSLPIVLVYEGTPRNLSLPVRDALFQIGREAITNVIRHSHAHQITLGLIYERRRVELTIRDDGIGFESATQGDFGIRAMQRRAEAISAELTITSSRDEGTLVSVRSPYGLRFTLFDWLRHRQRSVEQNTSNH